MAPNPAEVSNKCWQPKVCPQFDPARLTGDWSSWVGVGFSRDPVTPVLPRFIIKASECIEWSQGMTTAGHLEFLVYDARGKTFKPLPEEHLKFINISTACAKKGLAALDGRAHNCHERNCYRLFSASQQEGMALDTFVNHALLAAPGVSKGSTGGNQGVHDGTAVDENDVENHADEAEQNEDRPSKRPKHSQTTAASNQTGPAENGDDEHRPTRGPQQSQPTKTVSNQAGPAADIGEDNERHPAKSPKHSQSKRKGTNQAGPSAEIVENVGRRPAKGRKQSQPKEKASNPAGPSEEVGEDDERCPANGPKHSQTAKVANKVVPPDQGLQGRQSSGGSHGNSHQDATIQYPDLSHDTVLTDFLEQYGMKTATMRSSASTLLKVWAKHIGDGSKFQDAALAKNPAATLLYVPWGSAQPLYDFLVRVIGNDVDRRQAFKDLDVLLTTLMKDMDEVLATNHRYVRKTRDRQDFSAVRKVLGDLSPLIVSMIQSLKDSPKASAKKKVSRPSDNAVFADWVTHDAKTTVYKLATPAASLADKFAAFKAAFCVRAYAHLDKLYKRSAAMDQLWPDAVDGKVFVYVQDVASEVAQHAYRMQWKKSDVDLLVSTMSNYVKTLVEMHEKGRKDVFVTCDDVSHFFTLQK